MSVSPDYTQFIDMSLYDKDAADIVQVAKTTFKARVPDWVPVNTNVEVVLMEALAQEVMETVFSLNRLPETMLHVVLSMYGVQRHSGTPPEAELTFIAYDAAGYTIPAGTEVSLLTTTGEYVSFFTAVTESIGAGDLSKSDIYAVAQTNTTIANGIAGGTQCLLIDAVVGIEAVYLTSEVTNGTGPETTESWVQRGVQILQRLVDTLAVSSHFTAAALDFPLVFRANTYDNYDGTGSPGDSPGHVTVVVNGQSGALSAPDKDTLKATLQARAYANLTIHVIDPYLHTIDVQATIHVKDGYDATATIDAVTARLSDYLSPNYWIWDATVRINELISTIDQVEGVDWVGTISLPWYDISLTPGTLTSPGTITITAI